MRATRKGNKVTFHYRGSIIDNINKTEDDIEKCYEELDRLEQEFKVVEKIYKDYKS